MNAPKALAGLAVLVIAGFWGFLLIQLLQGIGYLVILSSTFVVLFAIGAYIVAAALGAFTVQPRSDRSRATGRLGALDMTVLQMAAQRKSRQDMAAATGVSLAVIGEKLDALTAAGFLQDDSLSEKGFDALRAQG